MIVGVMIVAEMIVAAIIVGVMRLSPIVGNCIWG